MRKIIYMYSMFQEGSATDSRTTHTYTRILTYTETMTREKSGLLAALCNVPV